MNSLDSQLANLTNQFTAAIVGLVRQNMASEIARAFGGAAGGGRRQLKAPSPVRQRRSYPPHCLADGCTNEHKGPRFSFMCAEHAGLSKTKKKEALAAWKESQKEG